MMHFINELSIKSRFIIAFCISFILFTIFSIYVIDAMDSLEKTSINLYENPLQMSTSILQDDVNFLKIENQLLRAMLMTDDYDINLISDRIREYSHTFYNNLNQVKERINNTTILDIERQTRLTFQNWRKIRDEVLVHIKNGNIQLALGEYKSENIPYMDNLNSYLGSLNQYSMDIAKKYIQTTDEELDTYKTSILIGLGLNFFVFIALSFIISKSINYSVSFFKDTIDDISKTNQLSKIDTRGNNEINDIGKGFNSLINKLYNQQWLREGINKINKELSNFTNLDEISNKSISVLADYIKAIRGAIYLYDKDDNLLKLYSSYAYSEEMLMNEIKPGETIIGQCVIEKNPITVEMNTGNVTNEEEIKQFLNPTYIAYHPLIYKEETIGIIEIGFLKKLNEVEKLFIEESVKVISSYLFILIQNQKIMDLLHKSEINNKTLNKIRDELSKAYEDLKIKSKETREFLQSTQDALTAHIAILDKNGEIISVNKAWEDFAEQNDLNVSTIGNNYIDVCETAEGKYSEEAPSIAMALKNILSGKLDSYSIEYPCHSPTEKRWFIARISKFIIGDKLRLVVAHENITTIKTVEEKLKKLNREMNNKNEDLIRSNEEFEAMNEELAASNEELVTTNYELEQAKNDLEELKDQLEASYTVVKNFPNGSIALYDENLKYLLYRGADLTEEDISSIEGKTMYEVLPDEEISLLEPYYKNSLKGISSSMELPFKGKDYILHFLPIKDNKGEINQGTIIAQDITKSKELETKLIEANKQINGILNNSTSIIYVKDLDGKYTLINHTFEKVFKVHPDDIYGHTDMDLFPKDIASKFIKNDNDVINRKQAITFEEDVLQDGKKRKYLSVKFPLKNKDGNIYSICGMSTDITERIEMEEAIRMKNEELNHRNEQFEAMNEELTASNEELTVTNNELEKTNVELETAYHELIQLKNKLEASDIIVRNFPNGAVLLFDRELKYTLASGQGLDDLNLREEDLVGKKIWDVYEADISNKLSHYYKKALDGVVSEFDIEYEKRIYNVSTLPIRDEGDRIVSGMAIAIDITKIKKMTEELKRINDKRKNAYEKLRDINKQLIKSDNERMIAYQKLEKSNKEKEIANRELADRNAKLEKMNKELEELNKELQMINLERKRAYEKNDTLQEMNKKLENINREREKAYKELEELKNKLQQSNEYKSKFLSNMSHELRTPLNSIIALSKLMEDTNKSLSNEEMKRIKVINQSGHDLLNLINDILDVSMIESGKTRLNISEFDLHELIKDMKDMFEHLSIEKEVDFIVLDDYKTHIVSDKNKVAQILKNLISNAFKFTSKGSITLKVAKNKENEDLPVKISVIDTGISIPKDRQEQIFESFYQIDSSIGRKFKGSGLGLAISKNLTNMIGGELLLNSQEGKGSNFTLLLPIKFNPKEVDKELIMLNEIQNNDDNSYKNTNSNGKIEYLYKDNEITKDSLLYEKKILIADSNVIFIFKYTSIFEELGGEVYKAMESQKILEILDNKELNYLIINSNILFKMNDNQIKILHENCDKNNIQTIIYTEIKKEEVLNKLNSINNRNDISNKLKFIEQPFEPEDIVKSLLEYNNYKHK